MDLHESGEMYLETILILSNNKPYVRSVDVSDSMGYSKPSVSRAMKILKDGGFIKIDAEGFITLTAKGKSIAEKIYERHTMLTDFLIRIGVDEKTAAEDACKIEHNISDTSFEAIKKYFNNL